MASLVVEGVDIEFHADAERATTLKSQLARLLLPRRTIPRTIHALQSVSLSIQAGERVGIVGANGAGKSTLLKVLAEIYPPRRGRVQVDGHVCPLFEFATGFEMDDTGWDNIRTRALLLGMPPRVIERELAAIGAFSNLGEFLDVPVRCYSSGMLLRLAFATSTAVEPDILLLDEVMAAGDAAFIESAKARMNRLMERANIVVFASHSLALLPTICGRTIWLDQGRIRQDGPTPDVVAAYEASATGGR